MKFAYLKLDVDLINCSGKGFNETCNNFWTNKFFVDFSLLKNSIYNSSEDLLIAEDFSSDGETQRHVREMSNAMNLALEGMLH